MPVIVHVLTKKGKCLGAALAHPEKFHGAAPFDPVTGESKKAAPGAPPNYQDVCGQALTRFAKTNPNLIGITGANHMRPQLSRAGLISDSGGGTVLFRQ